MIYLLASVVLAGDIQGPFEAGQTISITQKSWVLPDGHYSACLAKARDVESLTTRLDRCTDQAIEDLDRCDKSLAVCEGFIDKALGQFDLDEDQVNALTLQVLELERKVSAAEGDKARLRHQRNVAWAITGGVILTLGAGAALAIGG